MKNLSDTPHAVAASRNARICLSLAVLATLVGSASIAHAQSTLSAAASTTTIRGYAEFEAAYFDYPEYIYRDRDTSPAREQRLTADFSKIALHGSHAFSPATEVRFEVEVEHLGVATETKPNFNGPFSDTPPDQGSKGSVSLHQFYLTHIVAPNVQVAAGKMPVSVGLLSSMTSPTDYLGARPFESEVNLIPGDWAEIGVGLRLAFGPVSSITQIVSGLDSTLFSAFYFVAKSSQGRYGDVKTIEPAVVEGIDVSPGGGAVFGTSLYFGETTRNRPTADMVAGCPNQTQKRTQTAPCGYVHAELSIGDLHASYSSPSWRANALFLLARLRNAGEVNRANTRDRTNSEDFFTPIANRAYGLAAELAYNLWSEERGRRLEPFVRFEHFDSAAQPAGGFAQNPLTERRVASLGISWIPDTTYFAKLELARRTYGTERFGFEQAAIASTGFRF